MEYGEAVSSAPRLFPSNLNCTPATPTLSEALADTVTVPETVDPLAGAVMDTVGGVVSAAVVLTVTLTGEEVLRFAAASRALAVGLWAAFDAVVVFDDAVYGVAVASEPSLGRSRWNWRPG